MFNKIKNLSRKTSFILVILIVVICAMFFTYTIYSSREETTPKQPTDVTKQALSPVSDEEIRANDLSKKQAIAENNSQQKNQDQTKLTLFANMIGQDNPKGPLVIRTQVGGVSTGLCEYEIQQPQKKYTNQLINNGTSYACNIDIPATDLQPGKTTVSVTITSGAKNANTSQDTEIQL